MSEAKRCDHCGYLGGEPSGWLHVEERSQYKTYGSNVEGDFCSLDCVVAKYTLMAGGGVPKHSRAGGGVPKHSRADAGQPRR